MKTPHRTLLQQALDALTNCTSEYGHRCNRCDSEIDEGGKLVAALREALNAPEPEPVAWKCANCGNTSDCQGVCQGDNWCSSCAVCGEMKPLYAAPPAAPASQWMPIETAPKDGTLFLCWIDAVRCGETDEGRQYEEDVSQLDFCYWRTQSDTPDGGWFDPCCGQIGDQQRVSHWMPLPAAPDHLRDTTEKVAPAAPVPDGWVMVPLKFLQGFNTLAHNYCLEVVPPDYYRGTEADAFQRAYSLCGSDLRKLRDLLAAPPAAPAVREPLTDGQIDEVASALYYVDDPASSTIMRFRLQWLESIARPLARAIEKAHGITGGKP